MFIDVSKPIIGLDDEPVMSTDVPPRPVLISNCIVTALTSTHQNDQQASGEDKFKWFKLATKIHEQTMPVEISVEDAATIKKRIAMFYGALVVGRVFEAIETAGAPPPKKPKNGAKHHADDAPGV
jgi:hypothetical protein